MDASSGNIDDAERRFTHFREFGWPSTQPVDEVFETLGYDRVRATIDAGDVSPSHNRARAILWVRLVEWKAREESDRQHREFTDRTLAAAESSAASSKVSAKWALAAAAASLVSTLVTLAISWYKGEIPTPF